MNISVVDKTLILDSRKIETISTLESSGVIFDERMLWDSPVLLVISSINLHKPTRKIPRKKKVATSATRPIRARSRKFRN